MKALKFFIALFFLAISISLKAQTSYQTISDCKLRSGPGIKYKSLSRIKYGEKVNLLEKTNSTWYKIEYNGKSGFIASKLLVPIVEDVKVPEVSNIENKTSKPNSNVLYIAGGIILIIILFVALPIREKQKAARVSKIDYAGTNLNTEKTFKQNPVTSVTSLSKGNLGINIQQGAQEETTTNIESHVLNDLLNDNYDQSKSDNININKAEENNIAEPVLSSQEDNSTDPANILWNTEQRAQEETIKNILGKLKIEATNNNETDTDKEDSITDVTGKSHRIDEIFKSKQTVKVPYWPHQYVYSFSEINSATQEQKNFYSRYKESFLQGKYYDLEGNTNYAFILLFDLLNEYDSHQSLAKLEQQLFTLADHYPKTRSYCKSFLIEKAQEIKVKIEGVRPESRYAYQNYDTEYDWKLGSKYKSTLGLTDEEVTILNIIPYPNNTFCDIEFCRLQILKLYLRVITALKEMYIKEGTDLHTKFTKVAELIANRSARSGPGSDYYQFSVDWGRKQIFEQIFKYCENIVRELYGQKRKINTDTYYQGEVKTEFDTIISNITALLSTLVTEVTLPNEATDVELNSKNTSRWKLKFDQLTSNYKDNPNEFVESIVSLGDSNKKNPSIENIFFEASKFISKYDNESGLLLYVYYLYYDLKSAKFDNKQLTKTIQKSLFKTNQQLHDFEIIVSDLITDKDLDKALRNVPKIYEIKRKKIKLDNLLIKDVQEHHSETVQLLNEYLNDELENENSIIKSEELNSEEVQMVITHKAEPIRDSIYISSIPFTPIHKETLELFSKNNFTVQQSDLERFAKTNSIFKNQLIESLNEACYEILDDILIEEEEDCYIINEDYYQRLLSQ